jgi:hypothetical protein
MEEPMQITVKQALETLMRKAQNGAEFDAAVRDIVNESRQCRAERELGANTGEVSALILGKVAHQISFAAQDVIS